MSTLNSASTLVQIEASYADNASYAEDKSVTKCRAFITACALLLLKYPKRTGTPQADLETSIELIQKEKQRAEAWLEAHDVDTGSGASTRGPFTTSASFVNFR